MKSTSGFGSKDPTELYTLGKNCLLQGDFAKARFTLEKCLSVAENITLRLDVHNLLGQCCSAMNDNDLSCSHFKAAIEIDDTSDRGMLIKGFCMSWLGNHEGGLKLASVVLVNNPKSKEAYILQFKIYQTMKNEEKCMETFFKIKALEDEEMELKMQSMFSNVHIMNFDDYIVDGSDTEKVKEVLFSNGSFDLSIGLFGEALEEFQELLELAPDHVDAMYGAACCLDALGQKKESKKYLDEVLKIDSHHKGANKLLDKINF